MSASAGAAPPGQAGDLRFAGEVLGGAERGALELAHDLVLGEGASVQVCALDDRPGSARRVCGGVWDRVDIDSDALGRAIEPPRLLARCGSRQGSGDCGRTS